MGDEVITGGAKQQAPAGPLARKQSHYTLYTELSLHPSPPRCHPCCLGLDQRNVMILYSFKLEGLMTIETLMHQSRLTGWLLIA